MPPRHRCAGRGRWVREFCGAAFGGILAALDTGIGSGSMAIGWVIERYGFRPAWAMAAALAVLAVPYFNVVAPRFLPGTVKTD